jgi:hypothetical protein
MLAVRIMQRQGFEVEALYVRTVFPCSYHSTAAAMAAAALGVRLSIVSVSDDYLDLLRRPRFGYGKGLNPCVDCRLYMARLARRFLAEVQGALVVSGDVLGQRPMGQKRRDLAVIDRHSGLEGRLLRPLSAQLLPETIAEREGWVDRKQLYGIVGQGRRPLMDLAVALGIDAPSPSGGCALAETTLADRVRTVLRDRPDATCWDLELLGAGRQLLSPSGAWVIVGRGAQENALLEALARRADARLCTLLCPQNFPGPTALVIAAADAAANRWAAHEILIRSRHPDLQRAEVRMESAAGIQIVPAFEEVP